MTSNVVQGRSAKGATAWRRFPMAFLPAGSLALAGASGAAAQTTTGAVRGYVRAANGGPIADVQVSVANPNIGVSRGAMTNESGFYSIAGLRPGAYTFSVRRIGFEPQTRQVQVPVATTVTIDIQLNTAAAQLQTVVVTAEAGQETRTSEVGGNVSRQQIENLPNFERNFLDIARLVPGMTAQNPNNQDKTLAAGGQPAEAINVFVDGASFKNDVLRGGVVGQDASKGNPFPQGAVQEFRVITQNYKAEYQKASSAIITATTRSGSNQLEAEVFGYGIGKSYVARDPVAVREARPRPNFERLQAGGNIGGPIVRDKLFFFGTYEVNFRDEPSYVRVGSNAAQAPSGLNPSQYAGEFTNEFRQHLGFGKLTWNQSERSTVDVSATVRKENDFRGFGGQTSFESAEDVAISVYSGVGNWRYAGDRWLNEAQINVQNFVWNPRPKNPGLIGRDYQDIIRIGGRDGRQEFTQNRISLRDDVTRSGIQLGGDHVFKGGASVDFLGYEGIKDFGFTTPIYRYRSSNNYATPVEAGFGFGDPSVKTDNIQIGAYVQDDWAVTPKLTLNLGVRWDVETNGINNDYVTPQALADSLRGPLNGQLFVDVPQASGPPIRRRIIDELGGLDRYITSGRDDRKVYLGAFQPRLGASYDVRGDGRTVFFGGAGIYYDRNYWNTLFDEQFRRQFRQLTVLFRESCEPNEFNCAVWNDRYFDPATLRNELGFVTAPELFLVANDMKPPKTHQFSAGVRQTLGSMLVTVSYNGIRGYNGMNYVRASPWGGLGPNYSQVFVADDRVKTWYDAMQLQLERPLRADSRWGGAIAYALAKTEEQGQSTDIFWPFDELHPTVSDLPRRRAPGDQRHSVVANFIALLPWDLRFSSIVNLGSGIAVMATDASGGFGQFTERRYVFQPPTRPFLGIGNVFNQQNLDLRLEKGLTIAGNQRVSISADLFNALNSSNYGCYNATINPANDPNENYGRPDCAAPGRRLQVGLRYNLAPNRLTSSSQQQ